MKDAAGCGSSSVHVLVAMCCVASASLLLLLLLLQGVYYGGLPAAVDVVRSGLAKPEDFKLLLGMTGEEEFTCA
jgi:hypothetical protein